MGFPALCYLGHPVFMGSVFFILRLYNLCVSLPSNYVFGVPLCSDSVSVGHWDYIFKFIDNITSEVLGRLCKTFYISKEWSFNLHSFVVIKMGLIHEVFGPYHQ